MEKFKKNRLILTSTLIFGLAAGLTLEYVKVPVKSQTVIIEKVPVKFNEINTDKSTKVEFELPINYKLGIDENGNPYGYQEKTKEEIINIKLIDYLDNFLISKLGLEKVLKLK